MSEKHNRRRGRIHLLGWQRLIRTVQNGTDGIGPAEPQRSAVQLQLAEHRYPCVVANAEAGPLGAFAPSDSAFGCEARWDGLPVPDPEIPVILRLLAHSTERGLYSP